MQRQCTQVSTLNGRIERRTQAQSTIQSYISMHMSTIDSIIVIILLASCCVVMVKEEYKERDLMNCFNISDPLKASPPSLKIYTFTWLRPTAFASKNGCSQLALYSWLARERSSGKVQISKRTSLTVGIIANAISHKWVCSARFLLFARSTFRGLKEEQMILGELENWESLCIMWLLVSRRARIWADVI